GSSGTTCPTNRVVGNATATAHKAAITKVREPGFLFIHHLQSPLRFERVPSLLLSSADSCSFPRPCFLFCCRKNRLLLIVFQEFLDESLKGSAPYGSKA